MAGWMSRIWEGALPYRVGLSRGMGLVRELDWVDANYLGSVTLDN